MTDDDPTALTETETERSETGMARKDPVKVTQRNDNWQVRVQRQYPQTGGVEYAASYQRVTQYEDGTEATGVPLSLFIQDEETTRMLYACLREHFEASEPTDHDPEDTP